MRIYPVVLVLIALFSAPVFAKPTSALHEKYQFDQLETVKRFNNWSIDGWSAIDQQSLIVRTSPSTSYLLVLSRRLPELRYSHAIAITSTGSRYMHALILSAHLTDMESTSQSVSPRFTNLRVKNNANWSGRR